jgi:hypothetical protein
MTVYEVDTKKFSIQRQEGHAFCWTTAVICLVGYFKPGTQVPDQQGLVSAHGSSATGNNPRPILDKIYGLPQDADAPFGTPVTTPKEASDRGGDIAKFLTARLPKGPVLAQISEAKDQPWTMTSGKGYTFSHAAMIWRFDDGTNKVTFRDPARGQIGSAAEDVIVTLDALVSGFHYMDSKDFGQKTLSAFQANALPAQVFCRVKHLWAFA